MTNAHWLIDRSARGLIKYSPPFERASEDGKETERERILTRFFVSRATPES